MSLPMTTLEQHELARLRAELSGLVEAIAAIEQFADVVRKVLQKQDERIRVLELEIGALKFSRSIDEAERA